MPSIKPISELRNYGTVLKDVAVNSPVLLTKNGYGEYALLDIADYNEFLRLKAESKLNEALEASYNRGIAEGFADNDKVFEFLEEKYHGKD